MPRRDARGPSGRRWLPSPAAPLPAAAIAALRAELRGQPVELVSRYSAGAAALVGCWPLAHEPTQTVKSEREAFRSLSAALEQVTNAVQPECFPWRVREMLLLRHGVRDPEQFRRDLERLCGMLVDAVADASADLPALSRGKRVEIPGRDWIESELLALYAKVTGHAATSVQAAECAAIVLRHTGLPAADADTLRRRDRRRRTRLGKRRTG